MEIVSKKGRSRLKSEQFLRNFDPRNPSITNHCYRESIWWRFITILAINTKLCTPEGWKEQEKWCKNVKMANLGGRLLNNCKCLTGNVDGTCNNCLDGLILVIYKQPKLNDSHNLCDY